MSELGDHPSTEKRPCIQTLTGTPCSSTSTSSNDSVPSTVLPNHGDVEIGRLQRIARTYSEWNEPATTRAMRLDILEQAVKDLRQQSVLERSELAPLFDRSSNFDWVVVRNAYTSSTDVCRLQRFDLVRSDDPSKGARVLIRLDTSPTQSYSSNLSINIVPLYHPTDASYPLQLSHSFDDEDGRAFPLMATSHGTLEPYCYSIDGFTNFRIMLSLSDRHPLTNVVIRNGLVRSSSILMDALGTSNQRDQELSRFNVPGDTERVYWQWSQSEVGILTLPPVLHRLIGHYIGSGSVADPAITHEEQAIYRRRLFNEDRQFPVLRLLDLDLRRRYFNRLLSLPNGRTIDEQLVAMNVELELVPGKQTPDGVSKDLFDWYRCPFDYEPKSSRNEWIVMMMRWFPPFQTKVRQWMSQALPTLPIPLPNGHSTSSRDSCPNDVDEEDDPSDDHYEWSDDIRIRVALLRATSSPISSVLG